MLDRKKRYGQWYAPGEWNLWCQRCGRKIKSSLAKKEWDGLWLCPECYDERQPQDLVRGIVDRQATAFAAPESPDQVIPLVDLAITGITTAPLSAGPEDVWDGMNTLQVQITGGALLSSSDLNVLNGANMCAVMNTSGQWEVLQFVNSSQTGVGTYTLSRLLRARVGTEAAMNGTFPKGSPVVFVGQSSPTTYEQMQQYLGVDRFPFSVTNVGFWLNSGDLYINWLRRSKVPRHDQDDFNPAINDPVGEIDERYEVDVLSNSGAVLRTLRLIGSPPIVYPKASQIADFGSVPASCTVNVYQTSLDYFTINGGRSSPRQATAIFQNLSTFPAPIWLFDLNYSTINNSAYLLFMGLA